MAAIGTKDLVTLGIFQFLEGMVVDDDDSFQNHVKYLNRCAISYITLPKYNVRPKVECFVDHVISKMTPQDFRRHFSY